MHRGARSVSDDRLGVGADEPVELVGLEFGRLLAEGLQVGDPIGTGPGGNRSWKASAHRAVKPPALAPLITSHRPSTSPV
jgi:hypothetical protein